MAHPVVIHARTLAASAEDIRRGLERGRVWLTAAETEELRHLLGQTESHLEAVWPHLPRLAE